MISEALKDILDSHMSYFFEKGCRELFAGDDFEKLLESGLALGELLFFERVESSSNGTEKILNYMDNLRDGYVIKTVRALMR